MHFLLEVEDGASRASVLGWTKLYLFSTAGQIAAGIKERGDMGQGKWIWANLEYVLIDRLCISDIDALQA